MKKLVILGISLLLLSSGADLCAQSKKDPLKKPEKQIEKTKEREIKEIKEKNEDKKQTPASDKVPEHAMENMKEAHEKAMEARSKSRAMSAEVKALKEEKKLELREKLNSEYGVSDKHYEKFKEMSEEDINKMEDPQMQKMARNVMVLERMSEQKARYEANKQALKEAYVKLEAQMEKGELSKKEYIQKKEKLDAAQESLRSAYDNISKGEKIITN